MAPHDTDVARVLAPCGLHCGKCAAFADGPVREHARALQALLGDNFGAYAERFAAAQPAFEGYGAFRELLDYLASGACTGCRGRGCLFQACRVGPCARERGVDFCFQCADFPCTGHGMPERLEALWRRNNRTMAEQGPRAFYATIKDKPRYP
jgi:hypothetical protein